MEILENLSNILESILFVAGNPVPVAAIAEKLGEPLNLKYILN